MIRHVVNPGSTINQVYYPTTCWSIANFQARMRPPAPEFTPGYGGLFTVEFESVTAASAFFDSLDVHNGPSLGANVTLAQLYVQTVFTREKEWAVSYALSETIVRISIGLEDERALARTLERSVRRADKTRERCRAWRIRGVSLVGLGNFWCSGCFLSSGKRWRHSPIHFIKIRSYALECKTKRLKFCSWIVAALNSNHLVLGVDRQVMNDL